MTARSARKRIAVVGGGWAGLAAAVEAVRLGHDVTLLEMAAQLGGRARTVEVDGLVLDNGQHIMIGAYAQTLDSMRRVGVEVEKVLLRRPLAIVDACGRGFRMPAGPAAPGFAVAALRCRRWSPSDRIALLASAARWALRGFRCDPRLNVAAFSAGLPAGVRRELIEPLAVAALNTQPDQASAAVLLRVLKDALNGGRGSSDLLLPRVAMSELFPAPAERWLRAHGARVHLGCRAASLQRLDGRWQVDEEAYDAVVLAATAPESSRLARAVAPPWSRCAGALQHEAIATAYLRRGGAPTASEPMVALFDGGVAQFAFDLGALRGEAGLYAFVASAARKWIERGMPALEAAVFEQAERALPGPWSIVRTLADKRASFVCSPALQRPPARIAEDLYAAGDYVEGPYPGTLESAVRSGVAAARAMS